MDRVIFRNDPDYIQFFGRSGKCPAKGNQREKDNHSSVN